MLRPTLAVALHLLFVACSAAYAESAYKCQVEGKTVYQWTPCTGALGSAREEATRRQEDQDQKKRAEGALDAIRERDRAAYLAARADKNAAAARRCVAEEDKCEGSEYRSRFKCVTGDDLNRIFRVAPHEQLAGASTYWSYEAPVYVRGARKVGRLQLMMSPGAGNGDCPDDKRVRVDSISIN